LTRLWKWVVVVLDEHVGAGVTGQADQVLVALQRLQEEIALGAGGACWSRASPEAAAERSQRSWRAPNG
jgi:hypothetical protein